MAVTRARWKTAHRIAFVFSALFGGLIGLFAGMGHYDPYEPGYWLRVGVWTAIGVFLGALGGFLRQIMRARD